MKPYLFDEFFSSGLEENVSPFLTPKSRGWGKNLSLRSASSAALLLAAAFSLSFYSPPASWFCLSLVYFLVGVPALLHTINDLKNLEINIDILMTLAAFVAILIDSGLEGALLLVLFALSHGMEDTVSHKAKSALHHLNQLAPKFALVIGEDQTPYEKSVREIAVGTRMIVRGGEIIPLDGTVLSGSSSLNLVHLTGESLPVSKTIGDTVPAGGRNLESALTIEVSRTSSDSTLSRIIQLITQAQEAKPRLQRMLDQFGHYYASSIIALTFIFAATLPFIFAISYSGFEGSIYRALVFLIAASPCALIIATPTAYLSAISAAARKGILLKGGVTLDALAKCSMIAFDKTGTLTTGKLICQDLISLGTSKVSVNEALSIAYGLERHIVHPIATAVCQFAVSQQLPPAEIDAFKAVAGFGLEGMYKKDAVAIGLPEYIGDKLSLERARQLSDWIAKHSSLGKVRTVLLVGQDLFLFHFADQIRSETEALIVRLKKLNLSPLMLTGDHEQSAMAVASQAGITQVFANLRPEDKLAKVAELSEKGNLAMVGDGINDAPALARASVGISMGKIGSATAVDASDVVLLNDDLHLLSWLFIKARHTLRIVKQNLALALGVILFATLPALLGLVPLWAAVLLHEGGTVLVGLNSLRLLRR